MDERIISNNLLVDDEVDVTLRPKSFAEYIGQSDVKEMVEIAVKAAKIAYPAILIIKNFFTSFFMNSPWTL